MRKQALLILFLALAPGSGVQGQVTNSEIVLGAITLRLGMSQNEALAALGPVYDLRDLDGYNWLVSRRGSSMGDVGNIVFRDRTLTLVGKNWGPPSPTANQFARALYDAVRSITSGDLQACRVSSRDRGGEYGQEVNIFCGDHQLTVRAGGYGLGSQISHTLSSN